MKVKTIATGYDKFQSSNYVYTIFLTFSFFFSNFIIKGVNVTTLFIKDLSCITTDRLVLSLHRHCNQLATASRQEISEITKRLCRSRQGFL